MNFLKNFLVAFICLLILTILVVVCIALPAFLAVEFNGWWSSLYIVTCPFFLAFFIALGEESDK